MTRRGAKTITLLLAFVGATVAGYFISERIEQRLIKIEAEKQLSALLGGPVQIESARLALRGGLLLEGDRVGVYPSEKEPHAPRLFANRVTAEIDVTALLAGRFRLSGLLLSNVDFHISRNSQGDWEPFPVQALAEMNRIELPNPMDRHLDFLGAFEAVVRTLLSQVILADRFEIRNGRVIFVDESPPVPPPGESRSIQINLEQVNGRIVHHWLSGVVDLRVTMNLIGPQNRKIPIEAEGLHNGGGDLQLELSTDELPLDLFQPYMDLESGPMSISGHWGGKIHYETQRLKQGSLTTNGTFQNLKLGIPVENGSIETAHKELRLSTHIETDPELARIGQVRIETKKTALSIRGNVERPVSEEALLQLTGEINGLDLEGLREGVRALPAQDAAGLEKVLERFEDGHIDRVRGSGTANIARWEQLLSGQLAHLPPDFAISADLSDIRVRTGEDGAVTDLSGMIKVSEDRIELLDVSGQLNGDPLPIFNVEIHDFSNLLGGPEAERIMRSRPPRLPGLQPLFALFAADPREANTDTRPEIILKIDKLDFPVLRWPLKQALARINPAEGGSSFVIESGFWAGVPIEAKALWTHATSKVVDVEVWTHPFVETPATGAESATLEPGNPGSDLEEPEQETLAWASGRFEVPKIKFDKLLFDNARGFFRLQDQNLELHQIRADLEPAGKLLASSTINLSEPEEVPISVKLSIVSGDLSRIGENFGLVPDYATGRLHLAGELEGSLRPQTPILSDLSGSLRADARGGELRRRELPLLVALAQASEGYNEYAQRDSIAYESMTAQLEIEKGSVSTRNFELEGPLRIYASGTIDATRPPHSMIGVVGLFLFRGAGQLMESIPLVKAILPGSERGLVGAYYQVEGTFDAPEVTTLTRKSVAEDLPELLLAPYALLSAILTGETVDEGKTKPAEKDSLQRQATTESAQSSNTNANVGEQAEEDRAITENEMTESKGSVVESLKKKEPNLEILEETTIESAQ